MTNYMEKYFKLTELNLLEINCNFKVESKIACESDAKLVEQVVLDFFPNLAVLIEVLVTKKRVYSIFNTPNRYPVHIPLPWYD